MQWWMFEGHYPRISAIPILNKYVYNNRKSIEAKVEEEEDDDEKSTSPAIQTNRKKYINQDYPRRDGLIPNIIYTNL